MGNYKYRAIMVVFIFAAAAFAFTPGASSQQNGDDGTRGIDESEAPPTSTGDVGDNDQDMVAEDQQILDDLIVVGSICGGQDCVNGESFGFDTLRLKENNLRIRFQDTSSSASFPTNDWQLTANDSSNGGANKFSIDDIDSGRTPFTVEAAARSNALYVEADGDVGVGTSSPVATVHMVEGNTPTTRLEQDGSSGFTAQTWDLAGNESNFFIRDATNGSKLPFRIQPGAPTSSIHVISSGRVGIGRDPKSTNGGELEISETSGATAAFCDTARAGAGGCWELGQNASNGFTVSLGGTGGTELAITNTGRVQMGPGSNIVFDLLTNGNLSIDGTLTQGSSRRIKENLEQLTPSAALATVMDLEILEWSYKTDPDVRHIGPMAEDFYRAFRLGNSRRTLAPADVAGVSLLSVQALQAEVDELEATNAALESRLDDLESKLDQLLPGN